MSEASSKKISAILAGEAHALLRANRFAEAETRFRQAVAQDGADFALRYNFGVLLLKTRRPGEALIHLEAATRLNPKAPEAYRALAGAHFALARPDGAIAALKCFVALEPSDQAAMHELIRLLMQEERREEAADVLRAAREQTPRQAFLPLMLANVLRVIGKLSEARAVLEEDARTGAEFYLLADLKRFAPGDPVLAVMERYLQTATEGEDIALTKFALAKAYGDIGAPEKGFTLLGEANRFMRRRTSYREAQNMGHYARTRSAFTPSLMAQKRGIGSDSEAPIFILGMPRSGTTLVEQILASHKDVAGASENGVLPPLVTRFIPRFPEGVAGVGDLKYFAAEYLKGMGRLLEGKVRVTDKSLDSVFYAGLLHLAFPRARFIWVQRDPIDTCLSCYGRRFVQGVQYAYDLGELGRAFHAYEGLMEHWQSLLPPEILLRVRYEEVVADLEGQARRMLDHCGLEFDPACLAFHSSARPVFTASAAQVRQPLYKTSVGRWRPSDAELRPLLYGLGLMKGA
ncbi:tetratricopeptide (TPR) repeat protein [Rhizomicrobium palustre]|uniref:Tetratricopeptide (TPR) repeat protein n=1 Tax=Rhizomicrobium palustre TaxID=189966 RepID=A0A846MYC9_9PROT|nr:tetratricopeptide (TPR) repeat protein [Rhizomicrobium palustre]